LGESIRVLNQLDSFIKESQRIIFNDYYGIIKIEGDYTYAKK